MKMNRKDKWFLDQYLFYKIIKFIRKKVIKTY